MSVTFTKLFASITESTVWCEPDRTRICWITMLAMADHRGRVWASTPGLANRARIPVEDARIAIQTFLEPDDDSRSKENEGRRIEEIDGGWRLINHEKYRALRDEESIKEAKRRYINARRAKEKEDSKVVENVENVDRGRYNAEAEAEAEAEAGKPKPKAQRFAPPPWIDPEAWKGFEAMRTKIRKPMTDRARAMIVSELEALKAQGHDPIAVLAQSELHAWAGVFPIKANGTTRSPIQWWTSDEGIVAKGRELHLEPKRGESMSSFKARINAAIESVA